MTADERPTPNDPAAAEGVLAYLRAFLAGEMLTRDQADAVARALLGMSASSEATCEASKVRA